MKKSIIAFTVGALIVGTAFTFSHNETKSHSLEGEIKSQTTEGEIIECYAEPQTEEVEIAVCYAESSKYEMYEKAFAYIMDLDAALNSEMTYIALNYENEFTEEDKEHITKVLESYGVATFEADLEILSRNTIDAEYSDEFGNLYGILITIEEVEVSDQIIISFTKYKSGMGSVSTSIKMIQMENGEWEIEESDAPVLAS